MCDSIRECKEFRLECQPEQLCLQFEGDGSHGMFWQRGHDVRVLIPYTALTWSGDGEMKKTVRHRKGETWSEVTQLLGGQVIYKSKANDSRRCELKLFLDL